MNLNRKRASQTETGTEDSVSNKKTKKICSFGKKCYRRNPIHLEEFCHPHLDELLPFQTNDNKIVLPPDLDKEMNPEIITDQLKILIKLTSELSSSDSKISNKNTEVVNGESSSSKASTSTSVKTIQNKTEVKKTTSEKPKNEQNNTSNSKLEKVRDIHDYFSVVVPKGRFADKLKAAGPYNLFYTTVTDSPVTHNEPLSVTFQELLDKSLGDLESSLQINFMVDISWLMAQYYFSGNRNKPLLILYGEDDDDLRNINKKCPHVTAIQVKMADPFGKHHTKMMLFQYKDGSLRVVVSTANLYEPDWENRTQGLWVSPLCPRLPTDCPNTDAGNSATNFKYDLLRYLVSYKIARLQEWIGKVREADFSHINVFLITSVPGQHRGIDLDKYGHKKLSSILSKHCSIPKTSNNSSNWTVLTQCSSIGSLGVNPDTWLKGEFRRSLSRSISQGIMDQPNIKLIYPSLENVRGSHDNLLGGGCLPYTRETHLKQTWLNNYLCQWKAKSRHRNQAMPHIKTYCRVSPNQSRLAWFLLTSANLSKAAWGFTPKSPIDERLNIRSYEAGVLFLPKFVVDNNVFDLKSDESNKVTDFPYFPFPYDLPPCSYGQNDGPFFMNYLRE